MAEKYKLTNEIKVIRDRKLFRIEALVSFGDVQKADKGGWIEKEDNLSQKGNAWISGNACVYGDAIIYGNARVYGNAIVSGDAIIYGNARVSGNAIVSGDAWVFGDSWIYGNAMVFENARVSGNAWVSGDAKVCGDACVSGDAWIEGNAWVFENAKVSRNARVSGDAKVSGDCKIDVILCSRFNFESQSEVDLWIKKEQEFEEELKKLKDFRNHICMFSSTDDFKIGQNITIKFENDKENKYIIISKKQSEYSNLYDYKVQLKNE